MELRSKLSSILTVVVAVFSLSAGANPFDETFAGCARPATQDTLGDFGVWDPFSAAGNPAWAVQKSTAAVASGLLSPIAMPNSTQENTTAVLLMINAQKQYLHNNVIGILAGLPVGSGSLIDTGDGSGSQPLWTARARTFSIYPYYAKHLDGIGLNFGVALPVLFNLDSVADLNPHDDGYYVRLRSGLSPSFSYQLGVSYTGFDKSDLSISYGERHSVEANTTINGKAEGLGLNVGVNFVSESVYAFSPRRISLQYARKLNADFTLGALLRYSMWSEMPEPFLNITYSSPGLTTALPDFHTRDTLEAAIGASYRASERFTLFGSYRYQPSFLTTDFGYYDRTENIVGLGVGCQVPWTFDNIFATTRLQFLNGGGLYTWFGIGVGSDL